MNILLAYLLVLVLVGAVGVVASRRARSLRKATPPWVGAWPRGERYAEDPAGSARRTRTVVGALLGILIALPVMMLAGFAGSAQGPTRKR